MCPETRAMIQAFYSRSTMSIADRLATLGDTEEKMKKALHSYYVGYGHESIGELGTITVFFEGISMLAAKAIQDDPLYRGQESSTRYIDFAKQPAVVPVDANNGSYMLELQEKCRAFYVKALPLLIERIKKEKPYSGEVSEAIYNKTVTARAFDILRGFLPAGMTTNVAWTGDFRVIGRQLRRLMAHPLYEVRQIAHQTYEKLLVDYPNSFRVLRDSDKVSNEEFYSFEDVSQEEFITFINDHNLEDFNAKYYKFVDIVADHTIDFGSYRDLQRHRNCKWLMPLLTTKLGFHPFYLENLPESLIDEAVDLVAGIQNKFLESEENWQYAVPMGFKVNIMMKFDVNQAIYLAKLRSSVTVHPTLRVWAQELGRFLQNEFAIDAEVDYSEDNWTLKRGVQDIVKK